jgi:hypothetical protein
VRLSPLGSAATFGLLYQPQMIDEGDCVPIVGMKIGGGNRSTRRKPAQCYFVHHKSHMTWPGLEPGPMGSQRLTAWTMTRATLHSLLDYECPFYCVTDLVLIYESVTSSASIVRWLALNTELLTTVLRMPPVAIWRLLPVITSREQNRDRHFQQFTLSPAYPSLREPRVNTVATRWFTNSGFQACPANGHIIILVFIYFCSSDEHITNLNNSLWILHMLDLSDKTSNICGASMVATVGLQCFTHSWSI